MIIAGVRKSVSRSQLQVELCNRWLQDALDPCDISGPAALPARSRPMMIKTSSSALSRAETKGPSSHSARTAGQPELPAGV